VGKTNQFKASDFIDAIPGSGGIITTIARRVGCSWHTAKKYIDSYPTIKQAYDDECEMIADLAESTVIKAIRDGDVATAKWYLTMKANRGYAAKEVHEMTGAGGGAIRVVRELSDEELAAIAAGSGTGITKT
jgi:hypothetical protein